MLTHGGNGIPAQQLTLSDETGRSAFHYSCINLPRQSISHRLQQTLPERALLGLSFQCSEALYVAKQYYIHIRQNHLALSRSIYFLKKGGLTLDLEVGGTQMDGEEGGA